MSRKAKWSLVLLAIIATGGGGTAWYLLSSHDQAPVAVATTQTRLSTSKDGQTILTISSADQSHSAMTMQALAAISYKPELVAFGTLQEDPANSVTLRAPFAGTLRVSEDHKWPALGDILPAGTAQVGSIEPRYTPVERVDAISRLSAAKSDESIAKTSFDAIREEYDADVKLNGMGKNVSDLAVREAKVRLDEQAAKLKAAQDTIALLQSALASTTQPTNAIPLTVPGGSQVVEVTAHPDETIDTSQALLRVTRFDTLLATVALPAGTNVDPTSLSARVVALGGEDHPLVVRGVALASTVDAKTLGPTLSIEVEAHGLRPGGAVTAILTSSAKGADGVLVPRDAVVWHDGKAWVYLILAKDQFVRREVATDRPTKEGWFVTASLSSKDTIVVQGAQQLLSEEFKPVLPPNFDPDG